MNSRQNGNKGVDEMGLDSVDEMGLDKMGIDKMGIDKMKLPCDDIVVLHPHIYRQVSIHLLTYYM